MRKCLGCHGAAHMSDLDLRQTATMLKGGKRGPAVTPGNADASLLYQAVSRRRRAEDATGGKRLWLRKRYACLRDWINAGRNERLPPALQQRPAGWSFRKARAATDSRGQERKPGFAIRWTRSSWRKLDHIGLHAAPEADRRTLARRAYFDLHGLPPTPEAGGNNSSTTLRPKRTKS